ncbi:hypothetical protein [Microbulbifer aggregans]|uniref:hypothetical protein n=1 Tax=Microbulbifer aggregans TaxID=1769779 RepID=UPI001CFC7C9A|nr:hypothetical protein [Microbulbifer aggregans]
MIIQFSDCQGVYEQAVVWVMGISILVAIFSGLVLITGEKAIDKKGAFVIELLGPLHLLFTAKYLTDKAAKWRFPFFGSVSVIAVCVVCFNVFNVCAANT